MGAIYKNKKTSRNLSRYPYSLTHNSRLNLPPACILTKPESTLIYLPNLKQLINPEAEEGKNTFLLLTLFNTSSASISLHQNHA
jgi:hypothetical protein